MAKQTNQLPRELKQLDMKEIKLSLLYIRELRGRIINEESGTPPFKQPSPGPTHVQHFNDKSTPIVNGLPLSYVRAPKKPVVQSKPSLAQT